MDLGSKISKVTIAMAFSGAVMATEPYNPNQDEVVVPPANQTANQTVATTAVAGAVAAVDSTQTTGVVTGVHTELNGGPVALTTGDLTTGDLTTGDTSLTTGDTALTTGDTSLTTGDTSLTTGDTALTTGASTAQTGPVTVSDNSKTTVQGSYSYGIAAPVVSTPAGSCNFAFGIGLGGGNYEGNGSVGFGWQNTENQDCADAKLVRQMKAQAQMNEHALVVLDDNQAHEFSITSHKHNCERDTRSTVKQHANGNVVTVQRSEAGPADKNEHILCHGVSIEKDADYKQGFINTYMAIDKKTKGGTVALGNSAIILMEMAKGYNAAAASQDLTQRQEVRSQERSVCFDGVEQKAADNDKYNQELGLQICNEKFPVLKR